MQLKIRKFKLSEQFLEPYKTQEVPWGPVGYVTYKRTYARRLDEFEPEAVGTEEWWQTCRRVIEGMFNMQKQHVVSLGLEWNDAKAQRTAKDAYERLFTLKWTPPGRGLWMMGTSFVEDRTAAGLFNCFSKDTPLFVLDYAEGHLTTKTFEQIGDNKEINIPIITDNGTVKILPAISRTYGEQDLYTITFRHNWGKSNYRFSYNATRNHRWILADGSETTNLSEGDIVKITPISENVDEKIYNEGFAHGLIFGDGYRHNQYPERHMIRLCSERDKDQLTRLESTSAHKSTVYCESNSKDPFVTMVLNSSNFCQDWKSLPTYNHSSYIKGFVDGWICADSWKKPSGSICLDTQSSEAAEWIKKWAPIAGYTVRGHTLDDRPTNFGERSAPLNRITLSKDSTTYKVESIEYSHKDTVWCLEVQDEAKFTLAGGLVTGNCAFRSTKDLQEKGGYLFRWMMDALMLGIGVGFDTLGAGTFKIQEPGSVSVEPKIPSSAVNVYHIDHENKSSVCVIADSREGWIESVQVLLDAYIFGHGLPSFDYTEIREKGAPIKGFGGTSSGYEPLKDLHESLMELYQSRVGDFIDSVDIVDTENLIGKCVVAGNVRRSAALALGQAEDRNYLTMKNDKDKLFSHRWGSNNSFHAKVGMDYTWHAEQSQINGEPGYIWLDNARTYGRMKDPQRFDDTMVMGFNPCVEQQLEDGELCCLTETFPARHDNFEDYLRTLKIAYMYAKTVTLSRTQWAETNAIMLKNRRIGLSMSGVVQAFNKFGRREVFNWCDSAYSYVQELDGVYSDWLCIPRSKRTTSIKPSGTVSLLNGSTPGIHFPEDEYYIRRIRFADTSELLDDLIQAGYPVEDDAYSPNTKVVSFPVREPYFVKGKREVSMWEQLEIAAAMQHYWADNSVSVTVTFKPEEGNQIKDALEMYESKLKAVSFLKYEETGYVQAPYEPISEEEYSEMTKNIKPIQRFSILSTAGSGTKFCDGDHCSIDDVS